MGGECVYYNYVYQCLCGEGYAQEINYESGVSINNRMTPGAGNSHICVDIDECRYSSRLHPHQLTTFSDFCQKRYCQKRFSAELLVLLFRLQANFGNIKGGKIDQCGKSAICTNTVGGFLCACPLSANGSKIFSGTGYADDPCVDFSACAELVPKPCHESATCIDRVGGYQCTCTSGFKGSGSPEEGCTDMDECLEGACCVLYAIVVETCVYVSKT